MDYIVIFVTYDPQITDVQTEPDEISGIASSSNFAGETAFWIKAKPARISAGFVNCVG
jgi:hypothetical protein